MSPEEEADITQFLERLADILPEDLSYAGVSYILYMLGRAYRVPAVDFLQIALNSQMNLAAEQARQSLN